MGPLRKKSKPNPSNVAEPAPEPEPEPDSTGTNDQLAGNLLMTPSKAPATVESSRNVKDAQTEDGPTPLKGVKESSVKQVKPKSSWYGTWPRKSMASTQLARETILADKSRNGSSSNDLNQFEPKRPQALSASRPPSMYLGKSKETLDVTMGGTLDSTGPLNKEPPKLDTSLSVATDGTSGSKTPEDIPAKPASEITMEMSSERPITSSGWLGGWLSRPALQNQDLPQNNPESPKAPSTEEPQELPPPNVQEAEDTQPDPNVTGSSWFGLWSAAAPSTAVDTTETQLPVVTSKEDGDTVMEDVPTPKLDSEPATGSSWAFWSTDTAKKSANTSEDTPSSGELAVAGESSQNHPEPAKAVTVKETKKTKKESKRDRPQSLEVEDSSRKLANQESVKGTSLQSPAPMKISPPNLLLPSVAQTYRLVENPSILQQLARLLLRSHQPPMKHVFLTKDPPKIKKALAIGVHGLFPAPLLRKVIGEPTGTSIRFANHAAEAIRRWTDSHGSIDCEIEKVALEGEGKIAERVDNLWKLLLNWIDHIRKADFVLLACHSQGVPVAIMLVAKLIEFGVVTSARIGVCSMASVSLGPFSDYKSRLFGESTTELFEFANAESTVSKRYEDSLRICLQYGVRITYCGSIDDQLVSLESSTFSRASHPYIFRTVFVDGRLHAPDFISHLVGFALKLRNLGVSDHGLIRELSAPLAGSLVGGEGHSRLYDDQRVYDLSIEYALETTSVGDVPLEIKKSEGHNSSNPYVLPWIMRGLLEEDFVKTELSSETTELLKQFDDWKPATKVLKDVKYRLEAVRSKL
ncbi:Uncharacterized protein LHYA1_G006247 [Lachnellula hyalina]|uniref:YMC020W-like alpha/beta hydrolase domain-containing protein n=1 Tax=Lachnellula hyalina TaxID=1316788 RepID=A0A8H8TZG3_9HELO|nr:Uncharacterized protein LHYA1_G006247 [Lachnellula hyalina]TVY24941.1 Uncharacterized protein LHYA1_G006247 [Lachnellula hyalina]